MAGSMITEKYEYLTDIITSYDGHEQRIKTRQEPRRFLSYDYDAMDAYQAQWLRGLGRMRQTDTYYVPMWQSPVYLVEEHMAGKALYIRKEDMFNLRDCEWIEIFSHDDVTQGGINIVRQVNDYQDGSFSGIIGLKKTVNKKLDPRNTWIFPLKRCSVQPMGDLSYVFSNGTHIVHNFEDLLQKPVRAIIPNKFITEDEDYTGKNRWKLPEFIDGHEVLRIEPTWADDEAVKLSVDKAVNKLDNETGMFWYDLKNVRSYDTHTYQYILLNQEMIHNMIRFFKRVSGKWKSFFYPTWANDIQLIDDIHEDDNFIRTGWNKISQYYVNNKRKKKIVIFTKDWTSYIFDVITYIEESLETGNVGRIVLQSNAGVSIPKDRVLMISYLNFVRLDSDELQLNYETNVTANTTLVMREVDDMT